MARDSMQSLQTWPSGRGTSHKGNFWKADSSKRAKEHSHSLESTEEGG